MAIVGKMLSSTIKPRSLFVPRSSISSVNNESPRKCWENRKGGSEWYLNLFDSQVEVEIVLDLFTYFNDETCDGMITG